MKALFPAGLAIALLLCAPAELLQTPAAGQTPSPAGPQDQARGAGGPADDDRWALKRVGLGGSPGAFTNPIVVAVIDSGLDYFHPDLRRDNVWRNAKESPNGRDDDGNGLVDDLIGWNFVDNANNPWDDLGHGTHVAGIIAAANPAVRIMPLKVVDRAGRTQNARITAAVFYAVEHGARVINLSLGGEQISRAEQLAIDHAHRRGVVVVVAAGNLATDTAGYGPAGLRGALTVAATDVEDRAVKFSNWGQAVKLAAPGLDIVSLRARRTDFNLFSGDPEYKPGTGVVGPRGRFYRASGTSFAAPFVAGAAALLLARNPSLTNVQVERMLLMSADDIGIPGWDQFTGAGRLNAVKALQADPDWHLLARLDVLRPIREAGRTVVEAVGSVVGSDLAGYRLELGRGEKPERWKAIGDIRTAAVPEGRLGVIQVSEITARGAWTVRVVADDRKGHRRESRGTLNVN
jgi:subtilisin family serine protease